MMLYSWLLFVFILGLVVGSFQRRHHGLLSRKA